MSKHRFDLLVFDWDGTLSDSTGLIAECIQVAARDLGFREPTLVQAKSIIGLGLHQSTEMLFPELDEEARMRFAERFREHYVPRDHEATLYAGVRELLPQMQRPGRFLAVATGKPGQAWSGHSSELGSNRILTSAAAVMRACPNLMPICC